MVKSNLKKPQQSQHGVKVVDQQKNSNVLIIAFLLISTLSLAILKTVKAETTMNVGFGIVVFPSVGHPITCFASVFGDLPLTGNVTWS